MSSVPTHKIVILGTGGVGKSSITLRIVSNQFLDEYDPTIEDSYRKQCNVDGEICMLDILDTAGQEEYRSLLDGWIREGNAFVLVYSVTSSESFQYLDTMFTKINQIKETSDDSPPPPIVLFGNKLDLAEASPNTREVTTQQGLDKAAAKKCRAFEGSAKTSRNCQLAFHEAVRMIRSNEKTKNNKKNDTTQSCCTIL